MKLHIYLDLALKSQLCHSSNHIYVDLLFFDGINVFTHNSRSVIEILKHKFMRSPIYVLTRRDAVMKLCTYLLSATGVFLEMRSPSLRP